MNPMRGGGTRGPGGPNDLGGEASTVETHTRRSVYEHPDGRREIIKNGFSWPAFIFGPLWAWRGGMFYLGFALLALQLSLELLPLVLIEVLGEAGILFELLALVGVLIWIGSQGNEWRRKHVLSRGFKLVSASANAEGGTD